MIERFFKGLVKGKNEKWPPNCYGFALSQLNGQRDKFRDPEHVWKDYEFIGILRESKRTFADVPYTKMDIPTINASQAELIAFLDVDSWIGRSVVSHVIANKPDLQGRIYHRPSCYEPVESVQLYKLIDLKTEFGKVAVGFVSKKTEKK